MATTKYTAARLGQILTDMYNGEIKYQKKARIIDFAMKYGQYIIGTYSADDIIQNSGISHNYKTELKVALDYYQMTKEPHYG